MFIQDSVTASNCELSRIISSYVFVFLRPGFGGERCDQCETDFWGDPKKECIPCNCSPMGVNPEQSQCDHQTGKCFCLEGELHINVF